MKIGQLVELDKTPIANGVVLETAARNKRSGKGATLVRVEAVEGGGVGRYSFRADRLHVRRIDTTRDNAVLAEKMILPTTKTKDNRITSETATVAGFWIE